MQFIRSLNSRDQQLAAELDEFVPEQVFDVHAHLFHTEHFVRDNLIEALKAERSLGLAEYRGALGRWLPKRTVNGLYFGFPSRGNDRVAVNRWVAEQVKSSGSDSRALALVSPDDPKDQVWQQVRELDMVGLKPYHVYVPLSDTNQATIEQFASEWMWEVCHEISGVLMLHIMRDAAIADPENQSTIRRLCLKYPRCRLVLAHVARSFTYRVARKGLACLVDLDNVWVDTSAITETESIRRAIELLGPRRVLWGSDYPVSEFRGRCVSLNEAQHWVYREADDAISGATTVGLESLLCLREACEDTGLNRTDVEDIFRNNALRLLSPHISGARVPTEPTGPERWSQAWTRISGGTGLLSKRAELYDPKSWPSYFSKCSGSNVWDANGRRYVDFTGGVGAILLGYGDPDVNAAVRRRLNLGSHCTLCTPDEVELAGLLLDLHPWAGRVRYARGGGEALTVAVRVARAATGRSGIAFCGYHGWQDWYLAANLGDDSSLDGHLLPGLQPAGVPRELKGTSVPFRYNDLASFEEALDRLDGKLAGVVMEPMRSQRPRDGFLEKVAKRCREAGGVFMVDEVTSGWRFGFPGALATLGVEPDIAVYAKAMSNGFPCAAVIGRQDVMDAANPSFISSTYWTDGVGPAAALACIRKMQRTGAQQQVWELGLTLQRHLLDLAARHPDVRLKVEGQPCAPQISFDLGPDAQAAKQIFIRRMVERGFLVSGVWYVMLSHTLEHVDRAIEAVDPILKEIASLRAANRLQTEAGPRGGIRDAMGTGFARLA